MPSPALVAAWNAEDTAATFSTILDWCKISGGLRDGLLTALQSEADEPYRSLTLLSEEDASTVVDAVRVGEAVPGIIQKAKLRLFFAAAWHTGRGGGP